MGKTVEQLELECSRQYEALSRLSDEVMSMLHADSLRQASIDSKQVVEWLRVVYDEVQNGLGNPPHFGTVS
jgi:hypothetical protein